MGRKVCLQRVKGRAAIALHDADTGECLDGQVEVQVFNDENHIPTVVVTFKFTEDFLRGSVLANPEADEEFYKSLNLE